METSKIVTTLGDLVSAVFEAAAETSETQEEASALTKVVVDALLARSKAHSTSH